MIIRRTYKKERDFRYLQFFSSICTYKTKGIVQNQEIIYKLLQSLDNRKALLMNIKM